MNTMLDTSKLGKPCGRCGGPRELRKSCRPCKIADARKAYREHPERWKAYHAKRMAEHLDERRATTKAWKVNNPERYREYNRTYNAKYKLENPEYFSAWQKANPELCRARTRRHRLAKFNAIGSHTTEEWTAIVARQDGKCNHCGKIPGRPLERDHIVPVSRGGSDMAINIQGLCRTCNAAKSNALLPGVQPTLFDRISLVVGSM